MRKIIILLIGALACLYAQAQTCTLTGEIKNSSDTTLSLYLLYAGAHYRHQSVDIKVHHGKFATTISLPYPVFALFDGYGQERRLLLSPGRNLHIQFDAAKADSVLLAGTASGENNLLHTLKIGDMPFFSQGKPEENLYAKMPIDSLNIMVLNVTAQQAKEAGNIIQQARIPDNLKKMLSAEFHYVNQCYLYDFASNYMRWAKNKDQQAFLDTVMTIEPIPDNITLVNCLYANMMLDNQVRNAMINAGKNVRTDSVNGKRAIEKLFNMPFEEIMQQANLYGERYMLTWLYAKQNLPQSICDKILFNRIMEACSNKLYATARTLQDTMNYYYANSYYITMAKGEVQKMQVQLEKETNNPKIVFHTGEKITSLKELTVMHQGKVVYIDIWGTWCPPCREEMTYTPALKKRYIGKDIAFVYIDMDEAKKEADWKEMVRLYKLEGEHYRLDNEEIQALWKEIEQEGGETNRYPTYVLFDRKGKMIKPNAARPSDGEGLFEQMDTLLKE